MTPSRERGLAALLCAAGAGLTLLAAGRPWASVRARDAITPFAQELAGRDLSTVPGALGWAALAGLAALFATRGRVRAGVGALLALFGAGIGYAAVTSVQRADVAAAAGEKSAMLRLAGSLSVDVAPWWIASLAGGVLLVAAGLYTLVRGSRWPGMSARYERTRAPEGAGKAASPGSNSAGSNSTGSKEKRPAAPKDDDPAGLWKSLDRGEDPTAAEERRA
ncbi:Trp biosynthesis-associated membrane protein [Spirillospora sp. NPDC029432]|uniref:Trp biosynthesis-associated membrane protein n=1 Tax=Spirillospora sp. NPDC029432 TaxID=3154599 RepID=UPI0034516D8D